MIATQTRRQDSRSTPVREKLDEMINHLESKDALGMTHDELESYVVTEGRELQRRLVQAHLDLRRAAERSVRVVDCDGQERVERRRGTRRLLTLVGEVESERLLYQADGKSALCPQDAALNLPAELYSLGVRRRIAEEVAASSFDHAVERLAATTGAPVPKRQVEQAAVRAAADFDSFYADREIDVEAEKHTLMILTFDGAGIVVRHEDLRKATKRAAEKQADELRWPPKRLASGQKRNRKRMAEVAAVYGVAPYVREPSDIIRELRPVRDAASPQKRPRPVNKRAWASIRESAKDVIDEAFEEAARRDPEHQRRWVVLVDGNATQIELAEAAAARHGVDITIVVDVIHLLEYLWAASYCFHRAGTPEAEAWVTKRLLRLLQGADPSEVAAGLRRSATRRSVERRAAVDECADYLCKHRNHMRYGDALRAGLPIATGVIEGACRYLVRDRMDRTGARWSLDGAEAVLRLRALRANGDFDAYWDHHIRAEKVRVHERLYADGKPPSPLPKPTRLRAVK